MTQRELEWSAAWIALNSSQSTSTEGKLIALAIDLAIQQRAHFSKWWTNRDDEISKLSALVYRARGLANSVEPRRSQA